MKEDLERGKYLLTNFSEIMKDLEELDRKYELENIARRIKETKEMGKVLFDYNKEERTRED